MYIYIVPNGCLGSAFIFDNIYQAEEKLLEQIRKIPGGGFSYTFYGRYLNSDQIAHEYKFRGSIKTAGNLRFLKIDSRTESDKIYKEVFTLFPVDSETKLIDAQLEQRSRSSPGYIYFNSLEALETFTWNLKNKGLDYDKVEDVKDEDFKKYFKYTVYVRSV